jgi:hypothetical protein
VSTLGDQLEGIDVCAVKGAALVAERRQHRGQWLFGETGEQSGQRQPAPQGRAAPLSAAGWGSLVAVGERPKSAGARDGPGVDEWRLEPTFVGELVPRVIAAAQFKARRRPPPAAPAVPRENAAASRPPCVVETPPVGSPAEVLVIGDLGAMLLASPDAARLVSLLGRAGPSSAHR